MSRRESIGRVHTRAQSTSGPPVQQMVSVAVLPPRLPQGMAPPTGVGAADTFGWDESINWRHNEPIEREGQDDQVSNRKRIFRKAGLTTARKSVNSDLPPFTFRQVPYETWRKHYAKDKEGNYRGTHAPAEDCLLKPHDVQKWRLGEPVTKADQWTRGKEILPVYEEVKDSPAAPEYEIDYDGPPKGEPVFNDNDGWDEDPPVQAPKPSVHHASVSHAERKGQTTIADGKTAQEIIAEAKAKGPPPKLNWRQKFGKGIAGTMGA